MIRRVGRLTVHRRRSRKCRRKQLALSETKTKTVIAMRNGREVAGRGKVAVACASGLRELARVKWIAELRQQRTRFLKESEHNPDAEDS